MGSMIDGPKNLRSTHGRIKAMDGAFTHRSVQTKRFALTNTLRSLSGWENDHERNPLLLDKQVAVGHFHPGTLMVTVL